MKDYIQIICVFILFLALIPCISFLGAKEGAYTEQSNNSADNYSVKIYFSQEDEVKSYTMEEYLTGAVFAQMPADFSPEALKAQTVLAKSYIVKRRLSEQNSPTPELKGADISDDTSLYQSFFTQQQAKDFYGDEYEQAYKKINSAVKQAQNYILVYDGEPVVAAFHPASSGYTESAKTAWDLDIPYLQPVESSWDEDLENINSSLTISSEVFKEKISSQYEEVNFSNFTDPQDWLEISQKNEREYVTELKICGCEMDVQDFINLFNIPSPCFTFEFDGSSFIFNSKGCGHLVGMSQYGADFMAQQGYDFEEILMHYYTGCQLKEE